MSAPSMEQFLTPRAALTACLGRIAATHKEIARATGFAVGSVKNWRRGSNAMSAEALIVLMARYDDVFEAVCAMADRQPMTPEAFLDETLRRLKERP